MDSMLEDAPVGVGASHLAVPTGARKASCRRGGDGPGTPECLRDGRRAGVLDRAPTPTEGGWRGRRRRRPGLHYPFSRAMPGGLDRTGPPRPARGHSTTSPRNRPRAVSAVCTPPSARARPGRADRCDPMIGNPYHAVARRGLRRVTCGSSARAGGRRILSAVLKWTGAVPAALVVAASHCGCAARAHPEHQVRVLPSGWLHVDPVDVGEPPQTRLAQQHATQRLLCSVTPCMHEPSGCTDPVRPRALTARRHRRAPHGVWYPVEEGPFER